jgi:radical SAM superfamily enzyme YgiQ (UPF0313 family)
VRGEGEVLLVSTYELGHQPHGISLPAAFLSRAGFRPAALDLSVEALDPARVRAARLVAVSVPMHTALRLGLDAAARIRALNPGALLAFHGTYAPLHADLLVSAGARAVLGGECEEELVALAAAAEAGRDLSSFVQRGGGAATLGRLDFPVPRREGLPGPERYARLRERDGSERLAGYAEASRGCLHLCRHCPVPAVYGGRFLAIPVETVVEDVARQAAAGATHVTFGDPDFLNGPGHAVRIASALSRRLPGLTFDFTAKVEHLVRHASLLPQLAEGGAIFVTAAVESLSPLVLERLAKGHDRDDVFRAFAACDAAGLPLRPTLVPFTPWETLAGYLDLLDTFEAQGWMARVDPVQFSLRLLVPPGSLLLGQPGLEALDLDPAALSWRWRHPDPRMDRLQERVAARVEAGASACEDPGATLADVRALALAAAGLTHRHVARPFATTGSPRLTESWFC